MKHTAPGLTPHELTVMLHSQGPVTRTIYDVNSKARTNGMREAFVVNRGITDEEKLAVSRGVTPGRMERFQMKLSGRELTAKAAGLVRENTVLAIHGHPVHRDSEVAGALRPTYTDMSWFADDAANFNPNIVHGVVVPEGSIMNNRHGMHLVLYGLDRTINDRQAQARKLARQMKREAGRVGAEHIDPAFYERLGVCTVQLACKPEGTVRSEDRARIQNFAALRVPTVGLEATPMFVYQQ